MKRFSLLCGLILALTILLIGGEVFAKGFSSGGFRGGSSFRSSSSSFRSTPKPSVSKSYSTPKPSSTKTYSTPKPAAKPQATSGKYTSSGTESKFKSTPGATSAFARTAPKAQSKSSLSAYRSNNDKYTNKHTSAATPSYTSASSRSYVRNVKVDRDFTYDRYYSNRDSYYRSHHWNTPTYAYNSYSSFGVWDAMFMWMLLDRAHDRSNFAYNHANDPGYVQWRQEANRLAADNAELKAKLDKLDNEVDQLHGQPIDPNYMPSDIPAEIAIAAEVQADKAKIEHDQFESDQALKQRQENLHEEESSTFMFIIIGVIAIFGICGFLLIKRW